MSKLSRKRSVHRKNKSIRRKSRVNKKTRSGGFALYRESYTPFQDIRRPMFSK